MGHTFVPFGWLWPGPIIPLVHASASVEPAHGVRAGAYFDEAAFHMEVIAMEIPILAFGTAWVLFDLSLLVYAIRGLLRTRRASSVAQCTSTLILRSPGPRWVSPLAR